MNDEPRLLQEASRDVAEAYAWYGERSLGLGMDFIRCVEATLLSIQRQPLIYPIVHEEYRRALTHRFPYAVFFEQEPGRAVVHGVFHCSQSPEKWRRRLDVQ